MNEDTKIKLTPTQLSKLGNSINNLDISKYKSFTLVVNPKGDLLMDRWQDQGVTVEKIFSNPKVKVISCLN